MYDNISITGTIVPIDGFYNGDLALGDRALTSTEKELLERDFGYKFENHQIIDISQTQEYKNKIILKNIEKALIENDEKYEQTINLPINYSNSYSYKPSYANDYILILNGNNFPATIWDASGLNSSLMEKDELSALKDFLIEIKENAYQTKKQTKARLIAQKNQIQN